jgi:ABC-type phosphate transport system auxiliary subunit
MFQQTPIVYTCISTLIREFQLELNTKLDVQPFDEIYDEDVLNNKYDELRALNELIKCTQGQSPDVVQRYMHTQENIEEQIQELLLQRAIKYADWKKEVMRLSETKLQLSHQIQDLKHIDANISKLMKKRTKLDVMSTTTFHNMINTLLSVCGYQKENTPYHAFTVAFNKGLIHNSVYKRLVSRYT